MMRAVAKNGRRSSSVVVRRMIASDVPALLAILGESPEASMWTEASLLEEASEGCTWTAEIGKQVVGFIAVRIAADEHEILNLAVARAYRRQGVGTKLVKTALAWSRTAGAAKTFLEVRSTNLNAIAFYERLGFTLYGRRPNYYRHPTDDAALLGFAQN